MLESSAGPPGATSRDAQYICMCGFLQWSKPGSTRALLEHGANVHFADKDQQTAIMFAAQSGASAVVKVLLEHGADPNGKNVEGDTPLLLAASSKQNKNANTIKALVEGGADTDLQGSLFCRTTREQLQRQPFGFRDGSI